MVHGTWRMWAAVMLLGGGMASMAWAKETAAVQASLSRGRGGFVGTLERKVGLSPEQRDSVRGLLADQRQKTDAIREETDQKIRALLNPEQQKKFDTMLAEQKSRRGRKK